MINATKKWIFLKISGALLIPLMTKTQNNNLDNVSVKKFTKAK